MTTMERPELFMPTQGSLPNIGTSPSASVRIVPLSGIGKCDVPRLAVVSSPLTKALRRNLDILGMACTDPVAASAQIDVLESETRCEIAQAIAGGASGIAYVLDGASPATTTPMQYGGLFLESDRRLLGEASATHSNLIFVRGGDDPFIDVVSDLPAAAFAWEAKSGVSPEEVTRLRAGAVMDVHFEWQVDRQSLEDILAKEDLA